MRLSTIYMLSLLLTSVNIFGCATDSSERENLDALLWVQTSSEYSAAVVGTYAAATDSLRRLVAADPTAVDRMAVVMDLDETVLDNTYFGTLMVSGSVTFNEESWDQFVALSNSTAVPGAVDFIRASQELGVGVWFITNRACKERSGNSDDCPQKADTLVNLRQLGIDTDLDTLFLRGEQPPDRCLRLLSDSEHEHGRWTARDKTSRRQCVELENDIVMLVGDQLGDFVGELEESTLASRNEVMNQYMENWGNFWFVIPNPMYGDWLDLLRSDKRSHLRPASL